MAFESIIALITVLLLFLALLSIRLHIGIALMASAFVGIVILRSFDAGVSTVANQPFSSSAAYSLTVVPLFIAMGVLAVKAGLAQAGFDFASKVLWRLPGGSALASLGGSGLFAAVTGSSVATVATMARVSTEAITKAGHSLRLAAGVVCAGGTLGVLIPPSIVLVLYGVVAGESIGQLLLAGIGPGLLTLLAYGATAVILVMLSRSGSGQLTGTENSGGPGATRASTGSRPMGRQLAPEKVQLDVMGLLFLTVIFGASIGTIYMGIATPTEAASFGAIAALIVMLIRTRPPQWLSSMRDSFTESVGLTAMTFLLLTGAGVFTYFLALSGASSAVIDTVVSADLSPYMVLILCLAVLLPLGMFLDGLSMILIATPLLHPILTEYGFDGIWIGILVVKVAEMALITPPVGMNAFVYSGAVPRAGLGAVFRGILPFIVADVVVVGLLIIFPEIVTLIPSISQVE